MNMKYGIYVMKQIFNIFEDGSEKLTKTRAGWLSGYEHNMKTAKYRLEMIKETLDDECYDMKVINSKTIKGIRVSSYNGEKFALKEVKEVVILHIEKK